MLFSWKADRNSKNPLYIQLADYLRMKIKIGELKDGTKLPGRATLMDVFGVSKTTLLSAFDQLQREGLLQSVPKSGFVVTDNANTKKVNWNLYIKSARHRTVNDEYRHWGGTGGLLNFSLCEEFRSELYFQEALVKASERINTQKYKNEVSKYGLTSLRESIKSYLKTKGIHAETENIMVIGETFQRLYFLYETLLNKYSSFLYEETNIINTISNIHSLNMNMVPVKMDKYGISNYELERNLLKYKHFPVIHVDPTDQAPTGIVMSKKRREDIIRLAEKFRVPIVEIDHSANLWHDKPSLQPIKSLDVNGNVIYLGSLMKMHPFDFQLSWIVADRYIIENLSNAFIQSGMKPNYMMQIITDEMFKSEAAHEMAIGIKDFVSERREKALHLCDKYLKNKGFWIEKNCNFHFWIDFPGVNIKKLLANRKIEKTFYPGYFFDRSDTSHILLCPSCVNENTIESTIASISKLIA